MWALSDDCEDDREALLGDCAAVAESGCGHNLPWMGDCDCVALLGERVEESDGCVGAVVGGREVRQRDCAGYQDDRAVRKLSLPRYL